jgi:hypothetical protein
MIGRTVRGDLDIVNQPLNYPINRPPSGTQQGGDECIYYTLGLSHFHSLVSLQFYTFAFTFLLSVFGVQAFGLESQQHLRR